MSDLTQRRRTLMLGSQAASIDYETQFKRMVDGGAIDTIVIPNDLTVIRAYAFANVLMSHVVIPSSVTSIGSYAFNNCANLQEIEIPDSVTALGSWVFSNCPQLGKVVIGENVGFLYAGLLNNIKSHATVILRSSTPYSVGNDTFNAWGRVDYVYVPDASVETYKTTNIWSNIASKIKSISEYVES